MDNWINLAVVDQGEYMGMKNFAFGDKNNVVALIAFFGSFSQQTERRADFVGNKLVNIGYRRLPVFPQCRCQCQDFRRKKDQEKECENLTNHPRRQLRTTNLHKSHAYFLMTFLAP